MRIYSFCKELMSEIGRELNSYGEIVKPKTYQNKNIEGNEDMITKEIQSYQYCLLHLSDPEWLFAYSNTQEWAEAEFKERVSGYEINPGEAWKLNKSMWSQFLVDGHFDYTYAERINAIVSNRFATGTIFTTRLQAVIDLLKTDPDTRKAVLSIFDPSLDSENYDGSRRIPCSMYYDFLLRDNGRGKQLNIYYHQRSSDFTNHFGDDVYLAWRLMEYVASKVNAKIGYLYHTIDSLHVYKKDWHYLNSNIEDLL